MGMWTAIALISIACIIGGAYQKKNDGKRSKDAAEKLDAMQAKIDQLDNDLRERVETLERIVTDRRENLKREFDYLDKAS